MLVEGGEPGRNLVRARARIAEAAAQGAEVVLLPEMLDFGWMHPSAREGAGPIPAGESFEELAEAARLSGVYVCAGIAEREGDRVFNAAILIDPKGKLAARHRKINELEMARDLYALGIEVEGIAETPVGRIGLQICSDGFAEGQWIGRELAAKGAKFIISPCAWAVDAERDAAGERYGGIWRENYEPVARECGVWIAGCSNVGRIEEGPWKGHPCIGNSIVFDAKGREVVTGPYGSAAEDILYVEAG